MQQQQQQQQQIVQPIDHGANSARELDAINISAQTAAIYVQEVVITFFFWEAFHSITFTCIPTHVRMHPSADFFC